jgi:uncharacterized protein (DUF1697 family)
MNRYVAFLRAINVGGRTVRMERLRGVFESVGFGAVETFIASGNVIFESRTGSLEAIERKIERALASALGYEVATFVRRSHDLPAIARHQPFPVDPAGAPDGNIYIGFLRGPLNPAARSELLHLASGACEFDVRGREFYWFVRGNLLDAGVSSAALERLLGPATVRNRNTIVRLAGKYGEGRSS